MNKFLLHIVASVICILIPAIGLLYGLWDRHQPKTGPVGNGIPNQPTIPQMIPIVSCFIFGVVNLPFAIIRYRQNKRANEYRKT
ncbi:uncharacterized membrane-anchored protein YitT (DUF2179 family) [Paenibacillus rhizosphaerae]|uniref:Uncharacterized membrane-anchored protein YitT (DUF2179 family) n=1 Tax=Paenibacillus rhizosphaerae TaxID=297318 RepID=A0A839TRK6_9BACL|nr:hypothetical protein [Paenibacillus rhizosphaerae]MBB3128300.1 uncharacterized membrane-anchored protein YitT (DUF2179 family) [Paenibacillus rhizosphaerae]